MISIKDYVELTKDSIKQFIQQYTPKIKLVIVQIGNIDASNRYVNGKIKDCEECNIPVTLEKFPETITEASLLDEIQRLNVDKNVTGFIVQLPLPKHIREDIIIQAIDPKKDVDGFSKLALVNPATPAGIMQYLSANDIKLANKNMVILGRSNIVGKPLARLALSASCNVTVLHSKTSDENKRYFIKNADIIVCATGSRNVITPEYEVKPTAIIMDVGINRDESGKLCGDVEQDMPVAFKSPVPGGCGLLTRVALLTNLISLVKIQEQI